MKKKILKIVLVLLVFGGIFSLGLWNFKKDNLEVKENVVAEVLPDNNYRVIFDSNGGSAEGFWWGYKWLRTGVYALEDGAVPVLNDEVKYTMRNKHNILYWSLDHLCSTRDLEATGQYDASYHKVYYACYEDKNFDNNGIRYVQENAYVNGETVACGDEVHLTQCFKSNRLGNSDFTDYCEFDQIKHVGSSEFVDAWGTVYRNGLSNEREQCNSEKNFTATFHEDSVINGVSIDGYGLQCGNTNWVENGVCQSAGIMNDSVETPDTSALIYNNSSFIGWAADDDGVDVNCNGSLVTSRSVKLTGDVNYYACYASPSETQEEQSNNCSNSEKVSNIKGKARVTVCYNSTQRNDGNFNLSPIGADYYDLIDCAQGYSLDNVSTTNVVNNTCTQEGVCSKTYELSCVGQERPRISSVTNGYAGSNGRGTIQFRVTADSGVKGWYSSPYYEQPTINSGWTIDSSGSYSVEAEPGALFLWGIDNNNLISYAAMGSVIDTVNSDTTVKSLEIKTSSGENLTPEIFADNIVSEGITSSNYVRLSNELVNSSKILAAGFNPFDTAYRVKTNSETITVYATLTSNDSHYVQGFEPRTVKLNYGVNTILIKIQDKKGKTRTYTIVATREDDRDATNLLKNITVSEGKLKFDKYKTDYVVSVGKNKKSVSVNGELENKKSSFVDGYGPRKIALNNESTTFVLKVQSETGSVRAYTITFVKNGEETADKNDALLSSLSLSKAYINFDKNVFEYNTSVEFDDDSIDIYALAENGGDSVTIYRSSKGISEKISSKDIKLEVGSNTIYIVVANHEGKTKTYSINILRKEDGLNISSDTKLRTLDVNGYDIKFDPNKYDYQVKIKREKTLLISATPQSNRSEIFIRGNDNLTAFSTVRVKVVAEDGQSKEYNIDIQKDKFNKKVELIGLISGVLIIFCGIIIIGIKKKRKSINDYYAE